MSRESNTLAVLKRLTNKLLESITLEDALKAVADAALELIPGEHSSIRIMDDSGKNLLCGARSGDWTSYKPLHFRPGEGILGWVYTNGKAARVNNAKSDPRFKFGTMGMTVNAVLAVPILSTTGVMGVLGIASSDTNVFTDEHEEIALRLSKFAVPAIQKARLSRLMITDQETGSFREEYLLPRLQEEISLAKRHHIPLSLLLVKLDEPEDLSFTHETTVKGGVLHFIIDQIRQVMDPSYILIRRHQLEFAIILPDTNREQTALNADRIHIQFTTEAYKFSESRTILLSVFIGGVTWNNAESAEDFIFRGETSLREAKKQGTSTIFIY